MDSNFIDEKIKELNEVWLEKTSNLKNQITQELINEWIKKHDINSGDDILVICTRNASKTNKNVNYYRKAKLVGFNIHINLEPYDKNRSNIYFSPIIYHYNLNNKTLQRKRQYLYHEFFKMDLKLLGKEVIKISE